MTPRRFLYPRVVIEFYHTMTSRRESNPTTLHFSIEGRLGILKASDITTTFNPPVVLANSVVYRQWPHPSTREMVRLLFGNTTVGTIMFRRQLPPCMRLIDHILWSNLFLLQHIVQRREAILEALYRISEGLWFNPLELIMLSLFHFDYKVHRKSLPRAESKPLLFPRLLCQVLEHIGFPDEPRLERRHDCEAILTVDRWQLMPRSYHLPPLGPVEDQPAANIPAEEQPPLVEHIGEPQAPATSVPTSPPPAPVPPALLPSVISGAPSPDIAPTDVAASSTSAPPPHHITISTQDFLTIMDAIHTFSSTSASFATAHAALADRMTCSEAAMAQTNAILAQNQAILM